MDRNGQERLLGNEATRPHIVDIVGRAMGKPLSLLPIDTAELAKLTNEVYEQAVAASRADQKTPSLEDFLADGTGLDRGDDLLESDSQGTTVKLVNDLLLEAIIGASDVHLRPLEDRMIVRMRSDELLFIYINTTTIFNRLLNLYFFNL